MENVNRHGHFPKIAFSILTLSSEIALTVINDWMNLDYCEILSLSINSNSLFNYRCPWRRRRGCLSSYS